MAKQVGADLGPIRLSDLFLERKKDKPVLSAPDALQRPEPVVARSVARESVQQDVRRDHSAGDSEKRFVRSSGVGGYSDWLQRHYEKTRRGDSGFAHEYLGHWDHWHPISTVERPVVLPESGNVVRQSEHGGIFARMLAALRGRSHEQSHEEQVPSLADDMRTLGYDPDRYLQNKSECPMGGAWGHECRIVDFTDPTIPPWNNPHRRHCRVHDTTWPKAPGL